MLQLLKVLDKWIEMDRGVYDIYIDFMKVFDKVPHHHLISVMEYHGIENLNLLWIQAFL